MTSKSILAYGYVVALLMICHLHNSSVDADCTFDGRQSTCRILTRSRGGCRADEMRASGTCPRSSVCCVKKMTATRQTDSREDAYGRQAGGFCGSFGRGFGACRTRCFPEESIRRPRGRPMCGPGQRCCVNSRLA